jgi:hypothetical protein
MAQDGSEEQPNPKPSGTDQPDDREHPRDEFDMEFVPTLPQGRAVFLLEREGRFVWLVAEGAKTRQRLNEMRIYLEHIVKNGMWSPPRGNATHVHA